LLPGRPEADFLPDGFRQPLHHPHEFAQNRFDARKAGIDLREATIDPPFHFGHSGVAFRHSSRKCGLGLNQGGDVLLKSGLGLDKVLVASRQVLVASRQVRKGFFEPAVPVVFGSGHVFAPGATNEWNIQALV
jgi:hypothetical protein